MDEIIAALDGCTAILEEMSEESADPRIWTMVAALRWVIDQVDEDEEHAGSATLENEASETSAPR